MKRKYVIWGGVAGIVAVAIVRHFVAEWELYLEYELPEVGAEPASTARSVFMANGIKIGEVDSESAIIWTRITRDPRTDPETRWGRVVTGTEGQVRIAYWPVGEDRLKSETSWAAVEADRDFTHQFHLFDLSPATDYSVLVEARPSQDAQSVAALEGRFRTAPQRHEAAATRFAVVTCQGYHRRDDDENGHTIYKTMSAMDLDFLVHTGDSVYYDKTRPLAKTIELARFKWNRIYALPFQREFFNETAAYFMKDDHDTLKNDSYPGQSFYYLTWEQGLNVFREQVPMGESTYRTFRRGKHLQFWLVEGRDFRSANTEPDGDGKTIWGQTQKDWFFETVRNSDATYKILITPTPILGPDRDSKSDNHANVGFSTEGDELRSFIGSQKNMFIITGDRHWQYVSKDPEQGLIEFGSGPTTDVHANGYDPDERTEIQTYFSLQGGALVVDVSEQSGEPSVTFTHHAVDGSVSNTETFGQ